MNTFPIKQFFVPSYGMTVGHSNVYFQPVSYWWTFQFSSVTRLCLTLCDPMNHSTPGPLSITNSQSLLKLMSIELVMLSNHLIVCRPFLLLPSVFPSIRIFCNDLVLLIRWPKYWSFSFSISASKEYSGLTSFTIDWFDLLAEIPSASH